MLDDLEFIMYGIITEKDFMMSDWLDLSFSEIVENTKLHIDILEELLKNGNWGEFMPPIPTANPVHTPGKFFSDFHFCIHMKAAFIVVVFLSCLFPS